MIGVARELVIPGALVVPAKHLEPLGAIMRKERNLISRKYQARRRNTKAFAKERERRRMISCRIRVHDPCFSEVEVRKCMRPNILSRGFRYESDQVGREVKHAIGIEIGITWIDGELRVDVARRCRGTAGDTHPNYSTPNAPTTAQVRTDSATGE